MSILTNCELSILKLPKQRCQSQQYLLSSVQFSGSVVSDSLRPNELQHTRPPCPSPTLRVHSDSQPSSRWSCAWRPDFPDSWRESPWAPRLTSSETPFRHRSSRKPTIRPRHHEMRALFPAWHGEQNRVLSPDSSGGLTLFRPLSWLQEIPVLWEVK